MHCRRCPLNSCKCLRTTGLSSKYYRSCTLSCLAGLDRFQGSTWSTCTPTSFQHYKIFRRGRIRSTPRTHSSYGKRWKDRPGRTCWACPSRNLPGRQRSSSCLGWGCDYWDTECTLCRSTLCTGKRCSGRQGRSSTEILCCLSRRCTASPRSSWAKRASSSARS